MNGDLSWVEICNSYNQVISVAVNKSETPDTTPSPSIQDTCSFCLHTSHTGSAPSLDYQGITPALTAHSVTFPTAHLIITPTINSSLGARAPPILSLS